MRVAFAFLPLSASGRGLGGWSSFSGSEPSRASLDVPEIRRAMEVLTVFTQDEIERAAYESRMKALRDEISLLQEVREAKEGRDAAVQALREATEAAEQATKEAERAAKEVEQALLK